MQKIRIPRQKAMGLTIVCGLVLSLEMLAAATLHAVDNKLLGGAKGVVRLSTGEPPLEGIVVQPLEGIMVQLVSHKTAIRTTVYSDKEGRYEFPKLETGMYTLRIARPMEFKPYQRDSVQIDEATQLEDIVLERVTDSELLPPTPEILGQLVGVEWLMNIPGTGEEKRVFTHACGLGCHSYQQIFQTRYDEQGWRLIVDRMNNYLGSPLIHRIERTPESRGRSGLPPDEELEMLTKWLSRVRGPESKDTPLYVLPGPRGAATRVIITEYELPRLELAPHDVCGDSKGNIWYTAHRSPYVGKLDPKTGIVTEYRIPPPPGGHPGTHTVWIDKNDIVWLSENWVHKITRLEPRTGELVQVEIETKAKLNTPGFGNFGLHPDGSVWTTQGGPVKFDPATGKIVQRWPFKKMKGTYDNVMSKDGIFWAGGQWPGNYIGLLNIRTGQLWEVETRDRMSSPTKGGFDPEGNVWFGARGGPLLKLDTKTLRTSEYRYPTPYVTSYDAMPDKNGEVWVAEMHGGRMARFNPRTEHWIEYVLPEPYGHSRKTWIDNSTNPVTVWYADHNGYMVRVQPLE